MQRYTLSLAGFVASIGIALLPLLVVPLAQVVAESQKGPLTGLVFGLALLCAAVVVLMSRQSFSVRLPLASLIGAPLLLVAAVSMGVNHTPAVAWLGAVFEFGTVASIALFVLAVIAASTVAVGAARLTLFVCIGSALVSAVTTAVASMVGAGSSMFSNWPTVSMAAALGLVCAVALADWSEEWGSREWVLVVASALLGVCSVLFFNVVHIAAAAGTLLVLTVARAVFYTMGRASRLPILSLVMSVSLMASVVLGMHNPIVSVPPDIRPSVTATELVGGPLFAMSLTHTLLGAGPERFASVWNKFRPTEFNQTPLWNATFEEGNSTAATILIEFGVMGVLAWLLPVLIVGILLIRKIHALPVVGVAATAGVVCYFGASLFYTTGLSALLWCGVLLGLAIRSLAGGAAVPRVTSLPLRLAAAVVCAVLGVTLIAISVLQLRAMHYRTLGVTNFKAHAYPAAHAFLTKSQQSWATAGAYADDARTLLSLLQESAATSTPSAEALQVPLTASARAVGLDPDDLASVLTRASVSVFFAGMHVPGVESAASSTLAQANILAPNRPEVSYLRSVFAAQLGRTAEAARYLAETLRRKPDYQPALELQKQLQQP